MFTLEGVRALWFFGLVGSNLGVPVLGFYGEGVPVLWVMVLGEGVLVLGFYGFMGSGLIKRWVSGRMAVGFDRFI